MGKGGEWADKYLISRHGMDEPTGGGDAERSGDAVTNTRKGKMRCVSHSHTMAEMPCARVPLISRLPMQENTS